MSGIVWIASYPSSGNTWFRAFVSNLLSGGDRPVSINELEASVAAASRQLFDRVTCVDSGDLADDEASRMRPAVFAHVASAADSTVYVKIHDAFDITPGGEPIVATTVSRGAFYIVRNPLDVAVSFAAQAARPVDRVIDQMSDEAFGIGGTGRARLRQRLGSWTSHVLGWADADGMPVRVVRFEDMVLQPRATFRAAALAGDLPSDDARVDRAIEFSSFDQLSSQERSVGFRERDTRSAGFFRKGKVGSWRDTLTEAQAAKLLERHGEAMRRFGYISPAGEPIF